jgi:hypothetical protein
VIVAVVSEKAVLAVSSRHPVVARSTEEVIIAGPAEEVVVAGTSADQVVPGSAIDGVIPTSSHDHISPPCACELVVTARPDDRGAVAVTAGSGRDLGRDGGDREDSEQQASGEEPVRTSSAHRWHLLPR